MSAFVGDERKQLVRKLASGYDEIVAGAPPQMVCILAEAGWGKTRLIQEFYGWLQRERQPGGDYWPPELAPTEADPMRSRKVIYPEQVLSYPDRPMPWLWWGFRCEQDSGGRKLRVLLNDGVQLRTHLSALIEVAERRATDRDLAMSVLGEAIGFVPGVGQAVSLALAAKSL